MDALYYVMLSATINSQNIDLRDAALTFEVHHRYAAVSGHDCAQLKFAFHSFFYPEFKILITLLSQS